MQILALIFTLLNPPGWVVTDSPGWVVTETHVETVTTDDGCYLVMFTASWCGPCQTWKRIHLPRLEAAGHRVAQVDIGNSNQWGVDRVPTFWVIDRATKKTVRTFVGATSADTLIPLLKVRQSVKESPKAVTVKTTIRAIDRMSHSDMVRLHNSLHGGGSWSWPGDLRTHLQIVHGVE